MNLWPLVYYHDPALSVLWPLGEWTDDHAALRPFVAVYNLDKKKYEYSFCWPLVQFDTLLDQHRVIPFFWGEREEGGRYFHVLPFFFSLFGRGTNPGLESLAVVTVLAAMFPATTVLLARVFLHERLTARRLTGLALALVAVALVAAG